MASLSIICDNDDEAEEETAQGIQAAMGDMPLGRTGGADGASKKRRKRNEPVDVDIKDLEPKIKENIESIVTLIDQAAIKGKGFEVSELEFSLSFSAGGKVSLLSVVSADVTAHSGITAKIAKRSQA
jgi:hypothetical protein